MLMIFNIEAAVIIGMIAALFYGICTFLPSLSAPLPPFILAALTFGIGAVAEFVLGLRPRVGLAIPIWALGVAIFAVNVMAFFGPIPFYCLVLASIFAYAIYRIRAEKSGWQHAQISLLRYEREEDLDEVERLESLRTALFCNKWTRPSLLQAQHNISILRHLLRDMSGKFDAEEVRSMQAILTAANSNYRVKPIRDLKAFLFQRSDSQGIGRFR